MPKDTKERKKMVVEEVQLEEAPKEAAEETKPEILEEAASTESPEVIETPQTPEETEVKQEEVHEHHDHREHLDPPPMPTQKSPSMALWIIIPGIFLLGALLGGIVFYQKGVSKNPVPTETPSSTIEPSASEAPASTTEDLTKYAVTILNGSGIKGEAGKVQALLEKAGFKVGTTGNASTYDFTKTVIQAKADVDKAYLAKLSSTLSEKYIVDKVQTFPESSKDEVLVTVGSSKAE